MKKNIIYILTFLFMSTINIFANEGEILEPEEAFKYSSIKTKEEIKIKIELGENIYLYQDQVKVKLEEKDIRKDLILPEWENYDGFEVFKKDLEFNIPYKIIENYKKEKEGIIELTYQGCSNVGICYPPINQKIEYILPKKENRTLLPNNEKIDLVVTKTFTKENVIKEYKNINKELSKKEEVKNVEINNNNKELLKENKPKVKKEELSETDKITESLKNDSFLWTVLTFFGFGLLLALTPCIFPMIPILSSIIVKRSENQKLDAKKGFFLSLVYVLSMSVAYTIAGVLAGLFGANLQVALQNPYVLISFASIFVILALSMFGYFKLELPQSLQEKISSKTKDKEKEGIIGIAIMGFLSALIVGPCVAPPLAGALVYIGQTGDALLGGLSLFVMSLGMGIPLLLIGLGAGKFMPKPGGWMENITKIFGIVMLAIAIWLLERVLDNIYIMILGSLLLIGTFVYLWKYNNIIIKTIAITSLLYGGMLFVGAVSGKGYLTNPLEGFVGSKGVKEEKIIFTKIKSLKELNDILKITEKPIMLDFWAKWCVSCKELDLITFKDKEVIKELKKYKLLKIDMTNNTKEDQELLKRFELVGPPGLIFFDKNGKELKNKKIVGYKNPKEFIKIIKR